MSALILSKPIQLVANISLISIIEPIIGAILFVTGFWKNDPNRTLEVSR